MSKPEKTEENLTESQMLFLEYLGTSTSIQETADRAGITVQYARELSSKLKEVIKQRAIDNLATSALRASVKLSELIDPDSDTVKGELALKASEAVLDRSGVTKHTNVDVSVVATNGLFILPGKAEVSGEPEDTEEDVCE